jgi:hypothetical protein
MAKQHSDRELSEWLDRNGYHHAHVTKVRTPHPYAVSTPMAHVTKKTTVSDTKAAIRATGAGVKYQDGEWQVNVPRGTEATAYYTNDPEDATATARAMMSRAGTTARAARAHAARAKAEGQKFEVGDIVKRTAARMRSMGLVSGPVNGMVVGYSGKWPLIRWSDMSDLDEPMAQAEEGLELDKRAMAKRGNSHARMVESPTGREIYAAKERDHHITTHGRQTLSADQFALPPGPEEKRRGIKGRLPIDTVKRARNALARAAQMKKHGHLSASELATVKRKVHAHWPSIESSS